MRAAAPATEAEKFRFIPESQHSATLFVGSIAPEVTEQEVIQAFQEYGNVLSWRFPIDATTNRRLGYAYINYQDMRAAADARYELSCKVFPSSPVPIRVLWHQRDPAVRRAGKGNVFVRNLPATTTDRELFDSFSQIGPVQSVRLRRDTNGAFLRSAFVLFYNTKDATEACDMAVWAKSEAEAQGTVDAAADPSNPMVYFAGLTIIPYLPRAARLLARASANTNVFVKNIPLAWDQAKLEAVFSVFGKITSSAIDSKEGATAKFGFLNFESHSAGEKAIADMNGTVPEGAAVVGARPKKEEGAEAPKEGEKEAEKEAEKPEEPVEPVFAKLFVGWSQSRAERMEELDKKIRERRRKFQAEAPKTNLYVRNLPVDFDEDALRTLFAPSGAIQSATIRKASDGISMGVGFVSFSTAEEADNAIKNLNKYVLGPRNVLFVAHHLPREELIQRARAHQRENRAPQAAGGFQRNRHMPSGGFGGPAPGFNANAFPGFPQGPGFQASLAAFLQVLFQAQAQQAQSQQAQSQQAQVHQAQQVQMFQAQQAQQMAAMGQNAQAQQQMARAFAASMNPGAGPRGPGGPHMGAPTGGMARPFPPQQGPMGGQARGPMPQQQAPQQAHQQAQQQQQAAPGARGPTGYLAAAATRPQGMAMAPGARGPVMPGARGPAPGVQRVQMASNVVNAPTQVQAAPAHAAPASDILEKLRPMTPEQQRAYLGAIVHPEVVKIDAERAPKLTGMLLSVPVDEILALIDDPSALRQAVLSAAEQLREHESKQ